MAQNSINTNAGALTALRNLNSINRSLDKTQDRVSTGLRVGSALDDASSFSIAQGVRGELKALTAVTQGLNTAKGIGKVALAGTTSVSNILQDIRAKLTELSNQGITTAQRTILTNDFDALVSQALNFVANAEFNGINLLDSTRTTNVNTLSNLAGNTLILRDQDLRSQILSLGNADVTSAAGALTAINTRFTQIQSQTNIALGQLGADVRALELQTSFLEEIRDSTDEGLGNIVDADLARESAKLTALQVQQQLGIQTLSIANQRPQSLLSLFR